MPEQSAPASEAPPINDELPANAEVLAEDSEQISALLARFGMGPEAQDDSGKVGTGENGNPPAAVAGVEQSVVEGAAPTTEIPAVETAAAPAADLEATIAQRVTEQVAAKAKEFEPVLAERDQLAAQVEDLTAKIAAQTNPAPLPKDIDPLFIEDDFNVLARKEADAEKILAWCDQHEDTGFTPTKEGEEPMAPAQIRQLRREVEKAVNKTIPHARELAQARAQKRAEAKKAYPELFDGKSDAHKIRVGLRARAPFIYAVFPQFDLWLGHMLEGEKSFNTRQAPAAGNRTASQLTPTAGAPAPKPPTPPVLPKPGGAPLPTSAARKSSGGLDTSKYLDLVNAGTSGRDALIAVIKGG